MGHALNNTLQDVLCPLRAHARQGRAVAARHRPRRHRHPDGGRAPADGAGNISRRDLGREAFVEKVWEWKAETGGTIVNQLRRLGASCDWSRERFTLDEGLSAAVRKVFVDLYKQGLIYRDKRLVNWDPQFQTAISDLEVEQIEVKGSLWHFKYPLKDDPARSSSSPPRGPRPCWATPPSPCIPDDERYKDLIGKSRCCPLVGRPIPIIADEYADPEKGSGAVKITPAHDFNDFQVGKRHPEIGLINIFDATAHLNDNAPDAYRGLDRFAARKKVVADLEALGLVEKIEAHATPCRTATAPAWSSSPT